MTFGRRPKDQRRPISVPRPGATVEVIAGRHRGSKGVLESVQRVDLPSGGFALVAVVRRPRAGDTYVFATDLQEVGS